MKDEAILLPIYVENTLKTARASDRQIPRWTGSSQPTERNTPGDSDCRDEVPAPFPIIPAAPSTNPTRSVLSHRPRRPVDKPDEKATLPP